MQRKGLILVLLVLTLFLNTSLASADEKQDSLSYLQKLYPILQDYSLEELDSYYDFYHTDLTYDNTKEVVLTSYYYDFPAVVLKKNGSTYKAIYKFPNSEGYRFTEVKTYGNKNLWLTYGGGGTGAFKGKSKILRWNGTVMKKIWENITIDYNDSGLPGTKWHDYVGKTSIYGKKQPEKLIYKLTKAAGYYPSDYGDYRKKTSGSVTTIEYKFDKKKFVFEKVKTKVVKDPPVLKGTNFKETTVGKITLGDKKSYVLSKMGKPRKTEKDPEFEYTYLTYKGISLLIDDYNSILSSMYITSSKYKTKRGLKVGHSKNQVLKLYGQPDFTGEHHLPFMQYNSTEVNQWVPYCIRVYLSKNKVKEIHIFMPW